MPVARNLLLSGGYFHPFHETAPLLADVLRSADIESDMTFDIEEGLRTLASDSSFDLVTVFALRWRMLHPRFDEERDEWAFALSPEARRALLDHLDRGGGILALHTAAICFDDWDDWRTLVGASWNWERSMHPPPRTLRIDIAADHAVVSGLEPFEVEDEVYSFLDWEDDATPLLTCSYRGEHQPLLIARQVGAARVVYDALGHDRPSLSQPTHQTILRRGALWAIGRSDGEVRAAT